VIFDECGMMVTLLLNWANFSNASAHVVASAAANTKSAIEMEIFIAQIPWTPNL